MPYYYRYYTYRPSGRYSRVHRVGRPTNIVSSLIIINIIVFFIEMMFPRRMVYYFGLVPPLITHKGYVWQFVTYMFLHGNFWHLFFNMFALYIFGSELQIIWGARKFLTYYFFTGIGAGLTAYLFTNVPTIGASGAIYGLLLAYGVIFPNRLLFLYFLIPIRAKYLVIIFGIVELMSSVGGYSDGIAHIAHLGGMVFGAIYLFLFPRIKNILSPPRRKKYDFDFLPPDENDHIDRLLDKILRDGIESLTPQERRKLIEAGKFFAQIHHIDEGHKRQ